MSERRSLSEPVLSGHPLKLVHDGSPPRFPQKGTPQKRLLSGNVDLKEAPQKGTRQKGSPKKWCL